MIDFIIRLVVLMLVMTAALVAAAVVFAFPVALAAAGHIVWATFLTIFFIALYLAVVV